MKKILNRLTIMFSMLVFLACTDDSLDPFRFNELQKGIELALRGDAFDRLNDNGCSNSFYFNNVLATDAFSYDVDFLSEDQDLLQEVRVFALTIPTTDGKEAKPRTQVQVVPGSEFSIPDGGTAKRAHIEIKLSDIIAALGLTPAEVLGLSKTELTIEADIILTDGRTISSSSIVNSGLFESALFYPAQKLSYCALDVTKANPNGDASLRGAVVKDADGNTTARPVLPLKAGAIDTIYVKFDQKITNVPDITLSPDQGTLGNGGVLQTSKEIDDDGNYTDKDDPTAFFIVYTAPAGYTGAVEAKITGGKSSDTGIELTQNPASVTINVDNEDPVEVALETGKLIGRNQFNTITVTFNEPLVKAPEIKVYGQGIDGVGTDAAGLPDADVHVKMTIDAKDARKASYIFIYKDSDNPTNATHGDLSVDITGGEDGAGNVHAAVNGTLLCDVGTPPAPVVALAAGQYDYGTQIKWNITTTASGGFTPPDLINDEPSPPGNLGGSIEGTVFYWAVPSGSQAPKQKIGHVAGIPVNDGFMYPAWKKAADLALTTGDIVASGGSYWELLAGANTDTAPTEGADWTEVPVAAGQSDVDSGNDVFADFTANSSALTPPNTFDVYFYFVNTTGNVSPITAAPLTGVTMD